MDEIRAVFNLGIGLIAVCDPALRHRPAGFRWEPFSKHITHRGR